MIRVLIADDERVECQALERMVRENFPDAEVLESVMDGISLVKSVNEKGPDIVIVDINMPLLSGLDALEILRAGNPQMEILIHSAYSDFSFMRRAIQMGAADYLVKPVFLEDFKQAFRPLAERAREKKRQEEGADLGGSREWQRAMEKNILMSCLLGKPDAESFESYQRATGGMDSWQGEKMAFLCVSFQGRDAELFYSSLAEELKRRGPVLSVILKERLYCLLGGQEGKAVAESLRSFARRHELLYRAGLSACHEEVEELSQAVAEAENALLGSAEDGFASFQASTRKVREDAATPLAREAARFLLSGEGERAKEMLFGTFGEEVYYHEAFYAQRAMSQIAQLCHLEQRRTGGRWSLPARIAVLTKGEEALWGEEGEDRLRKPLSAGSFKALLEEELQALTKELEKEAREENPYVRDTLLFIRQHFAEDISLEQTADALGITQFYLSRPLKQELCQTFVELLTQERLTHVLLGLLDPDKSLQSISSSSGYSAKYLHRVFKTSFGLTPKELRDAMEES